MTYELGRERFWDQFLNEVNYISDVPKNYTHLSLLYLNSFINFFLNLRINGNQYNLFTLIKIKRKDGKFVHTPDLSLFIFLIKNLKHK